MFSPPHTQNASASAILPAEPQYWKENLPAGHGKYNPSSFSVLPLGFARSGSNNAQSVVYTAWMMIIFVINETVCFNLSTAQIHVVRTHNLILSTAQICVVRTHNCSDGFIGCSVGLVSSKPFRLARMQLNVTRTDLNNAHSVHQYDQC